MGKLIVGADTTQTFSGSPNYAVGETVVVPDGWAKPNAPAGTEWRKIAVTPGQGLPQHHYVLDRETGPRGRDYQAGDAVVIKRGDALPFAPNGADWAFKGFSVIGDKTFDSYVLKAAPEYKLGQTYSISVADFRSPPNGRSWAFQSRDPQKRDNVLARLDPRGV